MLTIPDIPEAWRRVLDFSDAELAALLDAVAAERRRGAVYPPPERVFAALNATPPEQVRVALLGQDPYHEPGQAQGLAFSVPSGVRIPPSLRNIFRELSDDLGCDAPDTGDLSDWAAQGVLLLNPVLTVRGGEAASHRRLGWEKFTDAVIDAVNRGPGAVFILWGAEAQKKRGRIDETRHRVIAGAHPSPLSAYRGFFGSRPFSRTNEFLRELGREPVNWTPPHQRRNLL